MDQKMAQRFEFGKNWVDFIQKNFSQERVDIASNHMLKFMGRADLANLTFLDIGCGSGLHALAALQAGASAVHGFDYDPNSVAATRYVQEQIGQPANWTVAQGSVLDDAFMDQLPQYDVVYSWGVLHHTGDVWHAVRNAAGRVKPGGLFYIALYSADVQIKPPPEFWMKVKLMYVSSGWLIRRVMELWYVLRFAGTCPPVTDTGREIKRKYATAGWLARRAMEVGYLLPVLVWRQIRRLLIIPEEAATYKKSRGMEMLTDIRDWLGGPWRSSMTPRPSSSAKGWDFVWRKSPQEKPTPSFCSCAKGRCQFPERRGEIPPDSDLIRYRRSSGVSDWGNYCRRTVWITTGSLGTF